MYCCIFVPERNTNTMKNLTEIHRDNLTNRLWDERGYDIPYLAKLTDKELLCIYDTEFFQED